LPWVSKLGMHTYVHDLPAMEAFPLPLCAVEDGLGRDNQMPKDFPCVRPSLLVVYLYADGISGQGRVIHGQGRHP